MEQIEDLTFRNMYKNGLFVQANVFQLLAVRSVG